MSPSQHPDQQMRLLTHDGIIATDVPRGGQASTVGQYWNAVGTFLATGDVKPLAAFRDVEINGYRLLTDPDAIESWAAFGEPDFEDIYNETGR
jgi:hypothetical protein